MPRSYRPRRGVPSLLVSLLASWMLFACGGGGDADNRSGGTSSALTVASAAADQLPKEPNAPQLSGNTATDGFNWFNFRRQQAGLTPVARNSLVDRAAQAHSDYEQQNDTISHTEVAGKPGFTGINLDDRLKAAGYRFTQSRYSYGEVLSATSDPSGFGAAEDLIGAIYHRFVALEPMFKEAGAGSAAVTRGYTYFTANFTANGLSGGLGRGNFITYPFSDQQRVPLMFFSDRESPDPVPDRNEVGYPVSIHSDITSSVTVQSFTLRPSGGSPLAVKLLTHASDSETPSSAAAIIPLIPLNAQTSYEAQFTGSVDGIPVSRTWSFTTGAQ